MSHYEWWKYPDLGRPGDQSKLVPDTGISKLRPDEPIFVTATEGGTWVPWEEWKKLKVPSPKGKRVHSIMFADGHVWDAYNGWRKSHTYQEYPLSAEKIRVFRDIWDSLMEGQEPEIGET